MDNDELKEALIQQARHYLLPLIFGIGGILLFLYGLMSIFQARNSSSDVIFEPAKAEIAEETTGKTITVDIEGAVAKPGVYSLASETRLKDALVKAGGLINEADRQQIAKNMNLAAPLTDGSKVYFPFVGDQTVLGAETNGETGLTNVNTASKPALEALPGIGPVTAEKIITNRPFTTLEELVSKNAISSSVYEKIKDKISVY